MASYNLPSWLETSPDAVAKNFVTGLQVGAQLGEARNKLAASQQQAAMETEVKQQQLEANTMQQAQELQVSKAYKDQQIQLQQQQVQAAQEKVALATAQAARTFQAQQSYQKDYQSALDMGLPEEDAARGAMFKNLSMFGTGSGMGAAVRGIRENQAIQPPTFFKDPNSNATIAMGPKGHILRTDTGMGRAGQPDYWTKFDATRLTKELDALRKEKAAADESGSATAKNEGVRKSYADRLARIAQINQQLQGMRGTNAPTATTGAKFRWNPETQTIEDNTAPSDDQEE